MNNSVCIRYINDANNHLNLLFFASRENASIHNIVLFSRQDEDAVGNGNGCHGDDLLYRRSAKEVENGVDRSLNSLL